MIKRPSKDESERELLRMQREYLAEKRKNKETQPAAKFVRLNKDGVEEPKDTRSAFARSRNIKKSSEKTSKVVIGDIVERKDPFNEDQFKDFDEDLSSEAFPKPIKLNLNDLKEENSDKTSLFGKTLKLKTKENAKKNQIHEKIGQKSVLLQGSDAAAIHQENIKRLENLSEEEIMKEREELLKNIDPSLIDFLKSKRSNTKIEEKSSENVKMDFDEGSLEEISIVDDLTKHAETQNWLHFDVVETEKLQWTKNVDENLKKLKPGEHFEARFDWKGVLLPYSDLESDKDDRELYLHGDEAHRPGYTLQELFRLARANVLQQRISALNSIAGILNIYNQGFYDGILELPISKIFFFLRFAMDENTPAIVEAASRALAYLFYNDTDEVLLDTIFEAATGLHQPAMERNKTSESDPLEDAFAEMSLEAKPFTSTLNDTEDDFDKEKESMNDFHLAETDLMECLLRTNILERIRYILMTIKPEAPTVKACLKILIRIARTNKEMATKILRMENLMKFLVEKMEDSLVVKLFRVLGAYDVSFCVKLAEIGVLEVVKTFIFSRKDINTRLIQMQIETFRFIRLYLTLIPDEKLYTDILPAIRYMLEWHYQHLIFEENGPFIIRQHATAALNLLLCGDVTHCYPLFVDIFELSLCKWFNAASRTGLNEFSQKLLLATCLDVCGELMRREPRPFMTFVDNYFRLFLESEAYTKLTEELRDKAALLQNHRDRSNILPSLPNLGSIVVRSRNSVPSLIFSKNYPTFLLHSILNFQRKLSGVSDTSAKQQQLLSLIFNEQIKSFIGKFLQMRAPTTHSLNWFVKIEILLVSGVVSAARANANLISAKIVLRMTLQLLTCLSQEMAMSILELMDDVVFCPEYYENKVDLCGKSLTVFEWKTRILISSWPYHLLSIFLNVLEAGPKAENLNKALPEKEIIETVMNFTSTLERSDILLVNHTEMLMYLMTAYLGPDSKFLEPEIKTLLIEKSEYLKKFNPKFNLDLKLESRKSFESLYSVFLDTFQGSSYGDPHFSALVMIPLAQSYDIKWRKRVWSEHIAVLRFVTCTEEMLFGGIENYLNPEETDVSLLKCYHRAIGNNLLREGTVPYKIAEHHLKKFNERRNQK
ncbi:RNA polymerase II-associated protein 1 [Culicoides brevitarsis]|uniref:RNA polymerase II-associated protein 1 n=1 Tax=Culicoides brevitarsis TaxID=469753 RepID=UPI00307BFF94